MFAQDIDCGYTLEPPHEVVVTSTQNVCFRAKIYNNVYLNAKVFQPFFIHVFFSTVHIRILSLSYDLVLKKPVFGVSDQVPHKPGCAGTEDG